MPAHAIDLRHLTSADAGALDRELARARAAAGPRLALDLSAVEFLSSTALSRFVGLHQELKARGGRLALVNARPDAVALVGGAGGGTNVGAVEVIRLAPRGERVSPAPPAGKE